MTTTVVGHACRTLQAGFRPGIRSRATGPVRSRRALAAPRLITGAAFLFLIAIVVGIL